jgi:RNA polymerase sigma-70 factor (ECF subfamily)
LRSGLTETEAQEVVQETVICVAKNIHKFKRGPEHGSFRGWLRNLTKWRIADQLRKRTRLPSEAGRPAPSQEQIAETVEATCDQLWDHEWKESLLKTALERVKRRVKEEHFHVFDLYALRQWPVSEVARTLGISIPAVYLAKHRVAALIKKEIKSLQEKG